MCPRSESEVQTAQMRKKGENPYSQLDHLAFELWKLEDREDTQEILAHAKRALPMILEILTPTQREYITKYFLEGMTLRAIAAECGVEFTTVSRTINRGLDRAFRYLQFTSPYFMKIHRERVDIRRLKKAGGRRGRTKKTV